MYKFLLTVWQDQPDGSSVIYQEGDESDLSNWSPKQIASALAAGLILQVEPDEGVVDGKSLSASRAHSTRRT